MNINYVSYNSAITDAKIKIEKVSEKKQYHYLPFHNKWKCQDMCSRKIP